MREEEIELPSGIIAVVSDAGVMLCEGLGDVTCESLDNPLSWEDIEVLSDLLRGF